MIRRLAAMLAACTGRPVGHIETQTASHCGVPLQTASWRRSSQARWVRLIKQTPCDKAILQVTYCDTERGASGHE